MNVVAHGRLSGLVIGRFFGDGDIESDFDLDLLDFLRSFFVDLDGDLDLDLDERFVACLCDGDLSQRKR